MKKIILATALAIAASSATIAQDKMNIKFVEGSTQSFDVEQIDEITFTEDDTPTPTPPAVPDNGIRIASINNMKFGYDDQGRLVSFTDPDDLTTTLDYTTGAVKMMGITVGSFKLNAGGYLSQFTIDFMSEKSTIYFTYNSDWQLVNVKSTFNYTGPDSEYITNDNTYTWNNGLLENLYCVYTFDGEQDIEVCDYQYSDKENTFNQWTFACAAFGSYDIEEDEDDNILTAMVLANMVGVAPARFPSSYRWEDEGATPVSYTFNSNGTVDTEKVGRLSYQYTYVTPKAAAASKDKVARALSKLRRHRR